MLFSSRFWLVTPKHIYLKKNTFRLLIDLFVFREAEMELILNVENWSLLLLLTVGTTIGKKKEQFPLFVVNGEPKRLWKMAFK